MAAMMTLSMPFTCHAPEPRRCFSRTRGRAAVGGAGNRVTLLRARPSCAAAALRAALFLLAVARTAQPVAAVRSLRGAVASDDKEPSAAAVCCSFELFTPFLALGAEAPKPGTRFEAAKVRALLPCAPLAECGGEATTLLPTADAGAAQATAADDAQRPFSLTMRLALPAAAAPPDWVPVVEAGSPPAAALLPPGSWTHFAGDSLLRGAYSTLSQYLRGARWEQWHGAFLFVACAPAQRRCI